MNLNLDYLKIDLVISLIRNYITLDQVANVGVLYVEETEEAHVNVTNGMGGFSCEIDISDVLEETDPTIIIKMTLSKIRCINYK